MHSTFVTFKYTPNNENTGVRSQLAYFLHITGVVYICTNILHSVRQGLTTTSANSVETLYLQPTLFQTFSLYNWDMGDESRAGSKMERTDMRMIGWMCGVSLKERQCRDSWGCDEKRQNEVAWTCRKNGVTPIVWRHVLCWWWRIRLVSAYWSKFTLRRSTTV